MRAIALFVLMAIVSCTQAATLTAFNIQEEAGKTSLFFKADKPVRPKIFTLSNPNRLVIDFKGTNLAFSLPAESKSSLIRTIRSGRPDRITLRIVFETSAAVKPQIDRWQAEGGRGQSLRIDLYAHGNKVDSVKPMPTEPLTLKPSQQAALMPVTVRHSPSRSLRDAIVVIDAGHGGKDPGARGPRGSQEKVVVLGIALKLKQLIDRQPGMRAILTRKGDYYIGLRERLDYARKYNADIFVSIHADAFINHHSHGASVFALSPRGATSEAARWLAEKENYSELGGVNLDELDDQNGVVRSVLIDLSQTATIGAGLKMGKMVLGQLGNMTDLHNHKVEQARFVVLKSPDIPSILVETGFISNPHEERNLTSQAYQTRLSQAIFHGLKQYFSDNPPRGTRIEALNSGPLPAAKGQYVVRKGDSLTLIAARHHLSLNQLCTANRLARNAAVRIGQTLVIPSA